MRWERRRSLSAPKTPTLTERRLTGFGNLWIGPLIDRIIGDQIAVKSQQPLSLSTIGTVRLRPCENAENLHFDADVCSEAIQELIFTSKKLSALSDIATKSIQPTGGPSTETISLAGKKFLIGVVLPDLEPATLEPIKYAIAHHGGHLNFVLGCPLQGPGETTTERTMRKAKWLSYLQQGTSTGPRCGFLGPLCVLAPDECGETRHRLSDFEDALEVSRFFSPKPAPLLIWVSKKGAEQNPAIMSALAHAVFEGPANILFVHNGGTMNGILARSLKGPDDESLSSGKSTGGRSRVREEEPLVAPTLRIEEPRRSLLRRRPSRRAVRNVFHVVGPNEASETSKGWWPLKNDRHGGARSHGDNMIPIAELFPTSTAVPSTGVFFKTDRTNWGGEGYCLKLVCLYGSDTQPTHLEPPSGDYTTKSLAASYTEFSSSRNHHHREVSNRDCQTTRHSRGESIGRASETYGRTHTREPDDESYLRPSLAAVDYFDYDWEDVKAKEVEVRSLKCYFCRKLFDCPTGDEPYTKFDHVYCSIKCVNSHRKTNWQSTIAI